MGDRKLVPPALKYLADNVLLKHNILGAGRASKASWAADLHLPSEGETVFFAGCGYQYSDELESLTSLLKRIDTSPVNTELVMNAARIPQKMGLNPAGIYSRLTRKSATGAQPLRDAVKVLEKLGLNPAYLGKDEPCCGGILHYSGLSEDFSHNARAGYQYLKSHGVKRIIGIVPSCTYTLRDLMPRYIDGYDLEVKHFCEIVAGNLDKLKLRYPRKIKAVYHDPCQLVRYLVLVEEPRRILRSIENVELVETAWTKCKFATCCGGGSGFEAVWPELSGILATNRVKELTATGAEVIVTHCPGCILQLKSGLKNLKKENIEVLDLAQVVARSMEVA
jgi:heterodisulfide reductase subunit B